MRAQLPPVIEKKRVPFDYDDFVSAVWPAMSGQLGEEERKRSIAVWVEHVVGDLNMEASLMKDDEVQAIVPSVLTLSAPENRQFVASIQPVLKEVDRKTKNMPQFSMTPVKQWVHGVNFSSNTASWVTLMNVINGTVTEDVTVDDATVNPIEDEVIWK